MSRSNIELVIKGSQPAIGLLKLLNNQTSHLDLSSDMTEMFTEVVNISLISELFLYNYIKCIDKQNCAISLQLYIKNNMKWSLYFS